ncbi:MAG: NUDIX domain-containing protein, partial [Bacteroidia bacterium]|nr:NUDIX domain-containing protein [Bacteroidia bacterium]
LIIHHKKKIYLQKRTENDIWKNLFDFPVIESEKFRSENAFKKSVSLEGIFPNCNFNVQSVSEIYHHKLSHQLLHARFWSIRLLKKNSSIGLKNPILADEKAIKLLPVSRLIERYLETHNIF